MNAAFNCFINIRRNTVVKPSLVKTFTGCFLFAVAYGVIFLIPLYLQSLGCAEDFIGFVLSFLGMGTMISIIASKFISARTSNKFTLLLGCICLMLGLFIFQWARIDFFYCLSAFLIGVGWGFYYNISAVVLSVEARDKKDRVVLFSYLAAFNVLGASLTPILFKYFSTKGLEYHGIFYVSIVFDLLALCCFSSLLNHKAAPSEKLDVLEPVVKKSKLAFLRHITILLMLMTFLSGCAFSFMTNFQTIFSQILGFSYVYFFLVYSTTVILSRLMIAKIFSRYDQYITSFVLTLVVLVSFVLFAISKLYIGIYILSAALFGFGTGLLLPIIQSIAISLSLEKDHTAVLTGIAFSTLFGTFIFPMIVGVIISRSGLTFTMWSMMVLAAIESLISMGILMWAVKQKRILLSP